MYLHRITIYVTALLLSANAQAQESGHKDSVKINTLSIPKKYNEVIKSTAITDDGLFKVHKVEGRYFFEIPDSLLDRELLVVNRIVKGPAAWGLNSDVGKYGYAGDILGKSMIKFSKGPDKRVFIKSIEIFSKSSDTTKNGLYYSVSQNNLPSITAAFTIKAYSPNLDGVVIDVTDYLNTENEVFFFQQESRTRLILKSLQSDKSYLEKIQSFPRNIELRAVRTYIRREGLFATYEVNSSVVLLPKVPMKSRYADARIGYFTTRFADYDANPQSVKVLDFVNRWRLEPKPQDEERYLRGELVEPANPIVFYIDPTTPKKWVPYLIQGVNAWQKAFEKAGFKKAIYALEAPENDSTWSLFDARHNAIVYKPSEAENASGPHVYDPRSGEILESHVNWFHNVLQLLHDWYFVQASAVDPRARSMKFDDDLMGQLIKYVCTHEIGHTLGLMHNWGASATVPVDSLRNASYLAKNGHTPSIMDYARFNYVAQPEDSIPEEYILPRIGVYDEWAIEWGYRWYPGFKNEESEKEYLNKWVIGKLKDKHFWFGNEYNSADPRIQAEDLGDDAVKASTYGIMNLKRIVPNLVEWTREPNQDYSSLKRMYNATVNQFKNYLFHVADVIGGSMRTSKTVEQKGAVIDYPSRDKQRAALQFLDQEIFKTPTWILDNKIYTLAEAGGVYKLVYLQRDVLGKLVSHNVLANLLWFETNVPGKTYTPQDFLKELELAVWRELSTRKSIDLYRRNLQKAYVEQLIVISNPYHGNSFTDYTFYTANSMTDVLSLIKGRLRTLLSEIKAVLPAYTDRVTRAHLMDVRERLEYALKPRE